MICVSLANISFSECVKALCKAEFAEIRLDQLDFSPEQFKSLFALKRKTIATCRPGKHTEEQRLELLKSAIEEGACYVDIEYESNSNYRIELSDFAHQHKVSTILSYHNFDITPSKKELEKIICQSLEWEADIVKIATTANSPADCARMMSLYEKHSYLIAFCMGKVGVVTRVAAPLLGALFTFASLDSKLATAPGQVTCDKLKEVYNILI
jgi:3-dehydroquinate dehydratase type I